MKKIKEFGAFIYSAVTLHFHVTRDSVTVLFKPYDSFHFTLVLHKIQQYYDSHLH